MRNSMLLVFFSLLAALPLHAGVVERDFQNPGDGLLTYDDVNQREWLDLTYTVEIELADIQSQMEAGGTLEGFEFATLDDIEPFALSAEVQWNQSTPNTIDPNLLQRSPAPLLYDRQITPTVSPGAESPGAENLIDLLGIVFTIQETFTDVTSRTKFTITDRSSFGQIAQSIADGKPLFDGTNVTVFFSDTLVQSINGTNILSQGGSITTRLPIEFLQATGDTGPFWLYRTTIPEPTSIVLLTLGTIASLSTRNRHR